MQLDRLLIYAIPLAIIACSGCLTEIKQNETEETALQNFEPFMAFSSGFHYQENWSGTPTRWMQANATLLVNSSENRTTTLSFNAQSLYRNRTLEVYVGDMLLIRAAIPMNRFVEIETPIHLAMGTNSIRLRVPEGCEQPIDIKELNSSDGRCLSVAIQNLALGERKPNQLKYLSGFYDTENWSGVPTRWMQANATLLVNSPENRTATLSFNAQSLYRNRTLVITAGDEPAAQSAVPASLINVRIPLQFAKGANVVRFQAKEGCERPSDIEEVNSSDERCLSVAVQNIIVT